MAACLTFQYFLSVARILRNLFHVAYQFGFSVIFSSLANFAPKLFCFFIIRLLGRVHAFTPTCFLIYFSIFSNILIYRYCFIRFRYLWSFVSFASYFRFISSSCDVCFTCVAFLLFIPLLLLL